MQLTSSQRLCVDEFVVACGKEVFDLSCELEAIVLVKLSSWLKVW